MGKTGLRPLWCGLSISTGRDWESADDRDSWHCKALRKPALITFDSQMLNVFKNVLGRSKNYNVLF